MFSDFGFPVIVGRILTCYFKSHQCVVRIIFALVFIFSIFLFFDLFSSLFRHKINWSCYRGVYYVIATVLRCLMMSLMT